MHHLLMPRLGALYAKLSAGTDMCSLAEFFDECDETGSQLMEQFRPAASERLTHGEEELLAYLGTLATALQCQGSEDQPRLQEEKLKQLCTEALPDMQDGNSFRAFANASEFDDFLNDLLRDARVQPYGWRPNIFDAQGETRCARTLLIEVWYVYTTKFRKPGCKYVVVHLHTDKLWRDFYMQPCFANLPAEGHAGYHASPCFTAPDICIGKVTSANARHAKHCPADHLRYPLERALRVRQEGGDEKLFLPRMPATGWDLRTIWRVLAQQRGATPPSPLQRLAEALNFEFPLLLGPGECLTKEGTKVPWPAQPSLSAVHAIGAPPVRPSAWGLPPAPPALPASPAPTTSALSAAAPSFPPTSRLSAAAPYFNPSSCLNVAAPAFVPNRLQYCSLISALQQAIAYTSLPDVSSPPDIEALPVGDPPAVASNSADPVQVLQRGVVAVGQLRRDAAGSVVIGSATLIGTGFLVDTSAGIVCTCAHNVMNAWLCLLGTPGAIDPGIEGVAIGVSASGKEVTWRCRAKVRRFSRTPSASGVPNPPTTWAFAQPGQEVAGQLDLAILQLVEWASDAPLAAPLQSWDGGHALALKLGDEHNLREGCPLVMLGFGQVRLPEPLRTTSPWPWPLLPWCSLAVGC